MTTRPASRKLAVLSAIAALAAVTVVGGCSGGGSDDTSSGDSAQFIEGNGADEPAAEPEDLSADDAFSGATRSESGGGSTTEQVSEQLDLGDAALIKVGVIELVSDDIGTTINKIEDYALLTGGRIDSEETATDEDGEEVSSRMTLKVPVDRFDAAYEKIAAMADLASKQRSTEDVTARLADIDSRVESAKDSIAQLRTLFAQATKLGEVIALERELSGREADLESLQAQQRALHAKTSMSTIQVTISQPPPEATPKPKEDKDQAGFVAGIKDGWDGLVTFVVGTSHALGLVLPLGALFAVLALLLWPLARRLTGRRGLQAQSSAAGSVE